MKTNLEGVLLAATGKTILRAGGVRRREPAWAAIDAERFLVEHQVEVEKNTQTNGEN